MRQLLIDAIRAGDSPESQAFLNTVLDASVDRDRLRELLDEHAEPLLRRSQGVLRGAAHRDVDQEALRVQGRAADNDVAGLAEVMIPPN